MLSLTAILLLALPVQDPVFSGPQAGETVKPLTGIDVRTGEPVEVAFGGTPVLVVAIHGMERIVAAFVRLVDDYGDLNRDRFRLVFYFLCSSADESRARMIQVAKSLNLKNPLLLSTHGSWLYHPHPHDYRRWTGEGLRREVEAQGFGLVRMQPVVGPLAWMTVFHGLGIAHALQKIPAMGKLLVPLFAVPLNAWAWLEDQVTPAYITENNACVYVALFRRAA